MTRRTMSFRSRRLTFETRVFKQQVVVRTRQYEISWLARVFSSLLWIVLRAAGIITDWGLLTCEAYNSCLGVHCFHSLHRQKTRGRPLLNKIRNSTSTV